MPRSRIVVSSSVRILVTFRRVNKLWEAERLIHESYRWEMDMNKREKIRNGGVKR